MLLAGMQHGAEHAEGSKHFKQIEAEQTAYVGTEKNMTW